MAAIFLYCQNCLNLKICNQIAGHTPVRRKIIKIIIFILYTWLIYNTYIFITAPYIIELPGIKDYLSYAIIYTLSSYTFFRELYHISQGIFSNLFLVVIIPILCFYITIYFWCKKQTIFRAWMLALFAYIAGPGLLIVSHPLLINSPISIKRYGIWMISSPFILLIIINLLQKKYWPNNKFCNRLRSILLWPCLSR